MPSKAIKIGSVTLKLYPWVHPTGKEMWRFAWYDREGKRRYTTRADRMEAIKAARDKARELQNGNLDLTNLSDEQARLARAFLDLSPTWEHIRQLRNMSAGLEKSIEDAMAEFLVTKNSNRGLSGKNTTTLRKNLAMWQKDYTGRTMASVTKADLDQWLSSRLKADGEPIAPRTRLNLRRSLVTFFSWGQKCGYVPAGITAAHATERPIIEDKEPLTLSPAEYRSMLLAVRPEYAPWLILGGFMGFRHEELYPEAGSKKPALTWDDFRWDESIAIVPKAVSKTVRRIVPIPPAAILWLQHHGYKPEDLAGRCCTGKPPAKMSHGIESETKRLGGIIGGWRANALRDSFISYRAAQIGIAQTAMEAGNSESEAKKSYLHAMSKADAAKFFAVKP